MAWMLFGGVVGGNGAGERVTRAVYVFRPAQRRPLYKGHKGGNGLIPSVSLRQTAWWRARLEALEERERLRREKYPYLEESWDVAAPAD